MILAKFAKHHFQEKNMDGEMDGWTDRLPDGQSEILPENFK